MGSEAGGPNERPMHEVLVSSFSVGIAPVSNKEYERFVLSGGNPGSHKIQGIGAGVVPDNLNLEIVDDVIRIANETAFAPARKMAKLEGIPIGISSGASIAASIELAQKEEMAGKLIVSILPSFAERYLSTSLFDGLTNT